MNKFVVFLVIILVAVVVIFAGLFVWQKNGEATGNYYAVYLKTGDIYFGKLSKFPYLSLSSVWYLQGGQSGLSINQFSKSVWGPEDEIRLNNDEIIWTAKLSKDSQILPILKGEKVLQQTIDESEIPKIPQSTSTDE